MYDAVILCNKKDNMDAVKTLCDGLKGKIKEGLEFRYYIKDVKTPADALCKYYKENPKRTQDVIILDTREEFEDKDIIKKLVNEFEKAKKKPVSGMRPVVAAVVVESNANAMRDGPSRMDRSDVQLIDYFLTVYIDRPSGLWGNALGCVASVYSRDLLSALEGQHIREDGTRSIGTFISNIATDDGTIIFVDTEGTSFKGRL